MNNRLEYNWDVNIYIYIYNDVYENGYSNVILYILYIKINIMKWFGDYDGIK